MALLGFQGVPSYFTFGARLAYNASFTINFSRRVHEHFSGIKA
jgi:hypothetical protein